jgi:opacity protein-like surface antigen
MREFAAVVGLLFVLVPGVLAAQPNSGEQASGAPDEDLPLRFSVHVGAGGTIPHADEGAGTLQTVSFGLSPTPKLTILIGGLRMHRPPYVRYYSDGGSSATRGGTAQFITGEVRFAFRPDGRISPYAMAGTGFGASRPTVNETFPNRVTNAAYTWFGGGGLAVPLGPHLRVSGDVGFFVPGERDVIRLILPVRAGLAWYF